MTPPIEDVPLSCAPAGAAATMATGDKEWKMGEAVTGMHINAMSFMRALLINENINTNTEQFANMKTKTIRQLGMGQTDREDNDVSGFVVVSDVIAAIIYSEKRNARAFANNPDKVNVETTPSLTNIASGNSKVTLLKVEL